MGGLPRITLKAADRTATTLQEGNVGPAEAKTGLVVEKITGGDDGLTTLIGKADPGALVKAAINGKAAGETRVADDGTWSLAATNASRRAADKVRLELIDKEGATLDRTDVPYKVPAVSAKIAAKETKTKADFPAVLTSAPKAGSKKGEGEDLAALFKPNGKVDADRPTVIRVRRGDSLWRIAKRHLGKGRRWTAFYKANKAKIDNPDLIYPGQTLIIPG
jgi:LysM repeat protein